ASGVKIVQPVREVQGLFKLGFVEDPWGTRIEVVQDPELLGLHHIHMRGPDPEAIFTWLLAKFGGERTKLKGRLDAVRYRAAGLSDMWILVQTGPSEPSEGHAIDHIGWRSTGPLNDTISGLKGKGVTVTSEPRPLPLPNGPTINFSYVTGPAGARIEIVERPGLKPGEYHYHDRQNRLLDWGQHVSFNNSHDTCAGSPRRRTCLAAATSGRPGNRTTEHEERRMADVHRRSPRQQVLAARSDQCQQLQQDGSGL